MNGWWLSVLFSLKIKSSVNKYGLIKNSYKCKPLWEIRKSIKLSIGSRFLYSIYLLNHTFVFSNNFQFLYLADYKNIIDLTNMGRYRLGNRIKICSDSLGDAHMSSSYISQNPCKLIYYHSYTCWIQSLFSVAAYSIIV